MVDSWYFITWCESSESNVAQQINKQQDPQTAPTQISEVSASNLDPDTK